MAHSFQRKGQVKTKPAGPSQGAKITFTPTSSPSLHTEHQHGAARRWHIRVQEHLGEHLRGQNGSRPLALLNVRSDGLCARALQGWNDFHTFNIFFFCCRLRFSLLSSISPISRIVLLEPPLVHFSLPPPSRRQEAAPIKNRRELISNTYRPEGYRSRFMAYGVSLLLAVAQKSSCMQRQRTCCSGGGLPSRFLGEHVITTKVYRFINVPSWALSRRHDNRGQQSQHELLLHKLHDRLKQSGTNWD